MLIFTRAIKNVSDTPTQEKSHNFGRLVQADHSHDLNRTRKSTPLPDSVTFPV